MKTSLSLFLILFSVSLFASINPIDLIVQADPTSHTVTMRTAVPVEDQTTVQIIDAKGLVLHTAQLAPGSYLNTRFELSALPRGEYRVVVKDALGQTIQPLTVKQEGIQADPALATRDFFPRVKLDDDRLTINYLNPKGGNVKVSLSDQVGNELINDELTSTTTVQRAYNLEKLPAGQYYVTVYAPNINAYTTRLDVK
ncbi:hypothetical protein [Neolewinella litorea]|uniref:T9SS type A sorting domain-containing protein n=1 Tax=Neolewinella litorea TaxID=2562452 RepID=A0A4S4NRJ4_9BACT|nr:hypothetical protein [Neolewinella litorea]THH41021.1 hypothetical protein E4021_00040 [Neolewinella litorea]